MVEFVDGIYMAKVRLLLCSNLSTLRGETREEKIGGGPLHHVAEIPS